MRAVVRGSETGRTIQASQLHEADSCHGSQRNLILYTSQEDTLKHYQTIPATVVFNRNTIKMGPPGMACKAVAISANNSIDLHSATQCWCAHDTRSSGVPCEEKANSLNGDRNRLRIPFYSQLR